MTSRPPSPYAAATSVFERGTRCQLAMAVLLGPSTMVDDSALRVAGRATVLTGRARVGVEWAGVSHAGNRRPLNEDAFCAKSPVFVVADGMGGHDGGDIASALAVGAMAALASARGAEPEEVRRAVRDTNRLIFRHSGSGDRTMGTTMTGLVVAAAESPSVVVLNVGDSRTYCLQSGELRQVTRDHSEVQELVDAGDITEAEAAHHPDRNVVTRALGVEADVEVDIHLVPVAVGQRWLMCSDGLSGELRADDIRDLLGAGSVAEAALGLITATLSGPAKDNVTVVVVDVESVEPAEDPDRTDPRRQLDVTAPNQRLRVGINTANETPLIIDLVPIGPDDGLPHRSEAEQVVIDAVPLPSGDRPEHPDFEED